MANLQTKVKSIIKEIAIKHGLPVEVTKQIVLSQFKLVYDFIKSKTNADPEEAFCVKIKGFGRFNVKSRKPYKKED